MEIIQFIIKFCATNRSHALGHNFTGSTLSLIKHVRVSTNENSRLPAMHAAHPYMVKPHDCSRHCEHCAIAEGQASLAGRIFICRHRILFNFLHSYIEYKVSRRLYRQGLRSFPLEKRRRFAVNFEDTKTKWRLSDMHDSRVYLYIPHLRLQTVKVNGSTFYFVFKS